MNRKGLDAQVRRGLRDVRQIVAMTLGDDDGPRAPDEAAVVAALEWIEQFAATSGKENDDA